MAWALKKAFARHIINSDMNEETLGVFNQKVDRKVNWHEMKEKAAGQAISPKDNAILKD